METRHNTTLLEKAVEQSVENASIPSRTAEAAAKEVEARAQAFRRLATGGGIALAAIGIGFGIWLALAPQGDTASINTPSIGALEYKLSETKKTLSELREQNEELRQQLERPETSSPEVAALSEQIEQLTRERSEKDEQLQEAETTAEELRRRLDSMTGSDPLTNYSIFRRKSVNYNGRIWLVTAGHEFASNSEKQWRNAWCYVNPEIDGVRLNIDLVTRPSPESAPQAPVATMQTLLKAGLTTGDALYLGSQCDWLDGKTFSNAELSKGDLPAAAPPAIAQAGDVLVYDGAINQMFLDMLRTRTFKTLQITSDGGSVQYALSAGEFLRSAGKNVEVRGRCFSACVFVVAGGVRRAAAPDAQIGVHQFYSAQEVDGDTATSDAQQLASVIVQYLSASGVDPELFHEMVKVPPSEIRVIPHDQLAAWKLLTPPDTGAALPPKPEERMVFEASDMIGGDGSSQKGLSQNECEESCRSDTLCKGFTYDKWNRLCLLKTGTGLLRIDPRTVTVVLSGPKPRKSSAPMQIMKRNRRAFPDSPYERMAVSNYEECAQTCMADSRCLGLNFRESSRRCEMFSSPNEYGPQEGVSIGIKSQATSVQ